MSSPNIEGLSNPTATGGNMMGIVEGRTNVTQTGFYGNVGVTQPISSSVIDFASTKLALQNLGLIGPGTYVLPGQNGVGTLGTLTPGGSYLPNIWDNVPLTGGTGTGAIGTINVNGAGSVGTVANDANLTITNWGSGYTVGDVLSATTQTHVFSTTGLGSGFQVVLGALHSNAVVPLGPILTATVTWSGLNYVPGSYTGVALNGGTGTGAQATIVVNGATNVSSVVITNGGTGYAVNDVLTILPAALGVSSLNYGSGLLAGGVIITVNTI
jgi:hypothetical protein